MKHIKIFYLFLAALFPENPARAQLLSDTVIYGFSGQQTIAVRSDGREKNTAYTFKSHPLNDVHENIFRVRELNITGLLRDNKKSGLWEYRFEAFRLENPAMNKSGTVRLNYKLNGTEDRWQIYFDNDTYQQKAILRRKEIINGRYGPETIPASAHFEKDTLKGAFSFSENGIVIHGQTDANGFLDGELTMEYAGLTEHRKYQAGFLLRLSKISHATKDTLTHIEFKDVENKLAMLNTNRSDINYKISNEWFGAKFNLGYRAKDKKIQEQEQGNTILYNYLTLFDSVYIGLNASSHTKTIFKLTRRFEFVYPSYEDSLLANLHPAVENLKEHITYFLERPNLVLRKNNSDTLYTHYETIHLLKKRIEFVEQVLDRIKSDYFKYILRHRYYENGIKELGESDTLRFEFGGNEYKVPVLFAMPVVSADSLIMQLTNTVAEIDEIFRQKSALINRSLATYENQDRIDSLDNKITELDYQLIRKYPDHKITESDKNTLAIRSFFMVNEEFLSPLKKQYLKNGSTQNATILLGEKIICYQSFLNNNKNFIDSIGILQQLWNDSLFTVYRENPFYFRKLETQILGGTQNAVNILLKEYLTQMLNAKSCQQLNETLDKIRQLDSRVKYLVNRQDNAKVQQLDKSLRRERVPGRIERILEL